MVRTTSMKLGGKGSPNWPGNTEGSSICSQRKGQGQGGEGLGGGGNAGLDQRCKGNWPVRIEHRRCYNRL
jgi:hypothetical protein